MENALEPIDPASHPDLSGVLAPVDDEIDAADLAVAGKDSRGSPGRLSAQRTEPKIPPTRELYLPV